MQSQLRSNIQLDADMDVRERPMFDATFYNDSVEIFEQQVLPKITQGPRKERTLLRFLQAVKNTSKNENNKWQAQMIRMIKGWSGVWRATCTKSI